MKNNGPKDNEPLAAILHLIGALLSVAALTLMIVFASIHGNAWHVVGMSIFGASLVLLYIASTLYHFIPVKRKLFLKIDHSMIFVLIAGTYTPICFIIGGVMGFTLFGIAWGLALLGVLLKMFAFKSIKDWVSTVLYIIMGWLIAISFGQLLDTFEFWALFWLVLGGVLYTLGTIFYTLDKHVKRTRWFGMHEIFHLFVLGGSFCHFWLMLKYVVYV